MQFDCLKTSQFWRTLQSELGGAKKLGASARFLFRWRKSMSIARQTLLQHSSHPAMRTVARDLGMFAAGYGLSRDLIGRENDLVLYRDMFLATAEKQMDWLWPAADIFLAQKDKQEIFPEYVSAYYEAYSRLKIYDFSRTTTRHGD